MKLELKHLAPYLPYGLKGVCNEVTYLLTTEGGSTKEFGSLNGTAGLSMFIEYCKPILRPLSDLTKGEIFVDGELKNYFQEFELEKYLPFDFYADTKYWTQDLPYKIILEFLENHFDIFGLIPQGLAIDINTLEL